MRLTAVAAATAMSFTAAQVAAKNAELFILGALHSLHEQEESFGYAELEEVVAAIRPDVLLLEVTPSELAGKLETKGRPEYPRVIWPLLTPKGPKAYAMEAPQPLYGELTGEASRQFGEFKRKYPAEDAALAGLSTATSNALLAHWKSVADTQDEATDALGRARTQLNAAMVKGSDATQRRWDAVMVETAKRAIAENPGKRILLLGSFRNRYMFVQELSGAKDLNLVDMEAWLAANGFGR